MSKYSMPAFGPASTVKTGGGHGPVAVNSSGTVVVVMQTGTQLVYTVGVCDPSTKTVRFGNPILPVYTWDKVAVSSFDVAMQSDGNQVVVVFQIGGGEYQLYYITGTLSGTTITWNNAVNYDTGANPSVTISGKTVIEVHNTGSNPQENLYYHLGTLEGATISNFHQNGTKFQFYQYQITGTSCWLTSQDWLVVTVTGGPYEGVQIQYYTEADINGSLQNRSYGYVAAGVNSDVVLAQNAFEVHTPNPGVSIHEQYIFLSQGTLDWQGNGSISWDGGINTNIEGSNPYISVAGSFLVMTYMMLDDTGTTMAVYATLS